MGCASCSQKYRSFKSRLRPIVTRNTRRVSPVRKKVEEKSSPVVQVQPEAAVVVAAPTITIEPVSGLALDLVKTGSCSERSVGDTALPALDAEVETYAEALSEKSEEKE